jgi:hypothetical protein
MQALLGLAFHSVAAFRPYDTPQERTKDASASSPSSSYSSMPYVKINLRGAHQASVGLQMCCR